MLGSSFKLAVPAGSFREGTTQHIAPLPCSSSSSDASLTSHHVSDTASNSSKPHPRQQATCTAKRAKRSGRSIKHQAANRFDNPAGHLRTVANPNSPSHAAVSDQRCFYSPTRAGGSPTRADRGPTTAGGSPTRADRSPTGHDTLSASHHHRSNRTNIGPATNQAHTDTLPASAGRFSPPVLHAKRQPVHSSDPPATARRSSAPNGGVWYCKARVQQDQDAEDKWQHYLSRARAQQAMQQQQSSMVSSSPKVVLQRLSSAKQRPVHGCNTAVMMSGTVWKKLVHELLVFRVGIAVDLARIHASTDCQSL